MINGLFNTQNWVLFCISSEQGGFYFWSSNPGGFIFGRGRDIEEPGRVCRTHSPPSTPTRIRKIQFGSGLRSIYLRRFDGKPTNRLFRGNSANWSECRPTCFALSPQNLPPWALLEKDMATAAGRDSQLMCFFLIIIETQKRCLGEVKKRENATAFIFPP